MVLGSPCERKQLALVPLLPDNKIRVIFAVVATREQNMRRGEAGREARWSDASDGTMPAVAWRGFGLVPNWFRCHVIKSPCWIRFHGFGKLLRSISGDCIASTHVIITDMVADVGAKLQYCSTNNTAYYKQNIVASLFVKSQTMTTTKHAFSYIHPLAHHRQANLMVPKLVPN
jgi:hypothetical protein